MSHIDDNAGNTDNININHVQFHDTNHLPPGMKSASAIKNILAHKVTNIEQLLSNAKKVQRLLDTTSNIGTNNDNTEHSDE